MRCCRNKGRGSDQGSTFASDVAPRSSSMVGNLNSRLRRYVFLRRHLGDACLSLLQFFVNLGLWMTVEGRASIHGVAPWLISSEPLTDLPTQVSYAVLEYRFICGVMMASCVQQRALKLTA